MRRYPGTPTAARSMCIRAAPSASIESAVTTVHRDPTWAIGAAGSALPSHGRGRRFEPGIAHERPHSTGGVLRFGATRCGIRSPRLPWRTHASMRGGDHDRRGVVHRVRRPGRHDRAHLLREAVRVVVRTRTGRRGLRDRRGRRAGRRPRRRRGRLAVRVLPGRRPRGRGRERRTPRRSASRSCRVATTRSPPPASASSGCAATTRGRRSACIARRCTEASRRVTQAASAPAVPLAERLRDARVPPGVEGGGLAAHAVRAHAEDAVDARPAGPPRRIPRRRRRARRSRGRLRAPCS